MEATKPTPDQAQIDPITQNRGAFNRELFGAQYSGGRLLNRLTVLQQSLLASSLTPEKVYHELSIVSGQAADRAESSNDTDMTSAFREMQKSFELTYESIKPQSDAPAAVASPTKLDSLPPMTDPKGLSKPAARTDAKTPIDTGEPYVTRDQQVLNALREEDKPITKEDLAKKLGISTGNLSTYISKLRGAGHKIELSTEENAYGYKLIQPEPTDEQPQATQDTQDAN